MTITDASQEIPCRTISSLDIHPSVGPELVLDGVEEIKGDLTMDGNPELRGLSSSSLVKIGGGIRFNNVYALRDIALPGLAHVQDISILHAPELDSVELAETGVTAFSIVISDTWLQYLRLDLNSDADLEITNNTRLDHFIGRFRTPAGWIVFTSNAEDLELDLSYLVGASELVVSNARHIHLPHLRFVNSSIEIAHNPIDSLSLPLLKTVGGNLSIRNNTALTSVDFPKLETINSSLAVVNNSAIVELNGFPELAHVSERVVIDGDFI